LHGAVAHRNEYLGLEVEDVVGTTPAHILAALPDNPHRDDTRARPHAG